MFLLLSINKISIFYSPIEFKKGGKKGYFFKISIWVFLGILIKYLFLDYDRSLNMALTISFSSTHNARMSVYLKNKYALKISETIPRKGSLATGLLGISLYVFLLPFVSLSSSGFIRCLVGSIDSGWNFVVGHCQRVLSAICFLLNSSDRNLRLEVNEQEYQ